MISDLKKHYGLDYVPFGKDIQPGSIHKHPSQQQAIARLTWCIAEREIAVLTGDVGAGKSVALRTVTARLDPATHVTIYVHNPSIGYVGLYSAIVNGLGGVPKYRHADLIPQAADLLAEQEVERGRTAVLVVDEAHLLGNDQLEDLRLLTHAEMDSRSHMTVILAGQPILRRKLKQGLFAALDQRITTRCAIDGMTYSDTKSYIAHHLELAGRTSSLFTDDAISVIHKQSRGLPRAVNNICRLGLIASLATGKELIDIAAANQAAKEYTAE